MDLTEIQKLFPKKEVGTRTADITNQHFNDWVALYRTENIGTKVAWVCECQLCGKIKPVSKISLSNGTSKNCGCKRESAKILKRSEAVRHFDDKGNVIEKRCFRCGQWLSIENFWKNSSQKDGYCGECIKCQNTAKENRYNIYKKGAKSRGLSFELSKEDFYSITSKPCEYCGDLNNYNGIDRRDSSEGYILSNCVPCCEICNKMKLDYDINSWLAHMTKILNHMQIVIGDKND